MPVYEITAPDGATYEIEGEGTPEEALAHFKAAQGIPPTTTAPQQKPTGSPVDFAVNSVLKPAARGAALGIAGLPNFLADTVVRAANEFRPEGAGTTQENLPSARFKRFLEQVGLPASSGLVGQLVEAAGETLGGMYGTPGIGTAAKAMPGRAALPVKPSAQEYARWVGLQSGYKLPPTSVPKTPGGNILESVSFPSKLRQEMVTDNQIVRNAAMREAAGPFTTQAGNVVPGMREGEVLTGKGLTDQISGIWNATQKPLIDQPTRVPTAGLLRDITTLVRETASPNTPVFREDIAKKLNSLIRYYDSDELLATIKQLRSEADDIARSTAKKDTAMQQALVGAADVLETRLGNALPPASYKDFTAGRKQMAQLATIRDATLDPTGNADAAEFANRIAKGLPTTGRPYTAGLFSANFPELSGLSRNAETELFDRISPGMGVSWIGGAFQALGKPIRSYLRSENYQTLLRSPGMLDAEKRMLLTTPATTYNLFQPE